MSQREIARGADWFTGNMDYPAFVRAGYTFAMRYIVPSIPGKMIATGEVQAAHNAGVSVGFIYETTGTTWQGGAASGKADGEAAKAALESIGAPENVAAYFAVDSQVPDSELSIASDYLDAADRAVMPYQMGVYGQYSVIREADNALQHAFLWQTAAWSNGQAFLDLHMFQDSQTTIFGIEVDTDSLFNEEAGLWHPSATPAPSPQPKGIPDMLIVHVTGSPDVYLYDGEMHHITSPENEAEFVKALPSVTIDETQFGVLAGGAKA